MPFELQTAANGVNLVLSGRLTVQQARPLWDALQPAVSGKQGVHLQAEGLEEMDTSIVQILCRLNGRPGALHIGATSVGFLVALKNRGLEKFFMEPPAPADSVEQLSREDQPTGSEAGETKEQRG